MILHIYVEIIMCALKNNQLFNKGLQTHYHKLQPVTEKSVYLSGLSVFKENCDS